MVCTKILWQRDGATEFTVELTALSQVPHGKAITATWDLIEKTVESFPLQGHVMREKSNTGAARHEGAPSLEQSTSKLGSAFPSSAQPTFISFCLSLTRAPANTARSLKLEHFLEAVDVTVLNDEEFCPAVPLLQNGFPVLERSNFHGLSNL